jgi:chromosome partitioning protein
MFDTNDTSVRIAVFNHKGGTGKTTTAVNLAAGLAEEGKRVLLVDTDPQGNVGTSLGVQGEYGLEHVLLQGVTLQDARVPVRDNLDVITCNEKFAAEELRLAALSNASSVFADVLSGQTGAYDVVVLDCAPAISLINRQVLSYATFMMMPVSCDYLSLVGVRHVLRTLDRVKAFAAHDIQILGVLPTFYDVRTKVCREAVDALQDHFGANCLHPIRVNTRIKEAPSLRKSVFEYAPESHGALDYRALVQEVISRTGEYEQFMRDHAEGAMHDASFDLNGEVFDGFDLEDDLSDLGYGASGLTRHGYDTPATTGAQLPQV